MSFFTYNHWENFLLCGKYISIYLLFILPAIEINHDFEKKVLDVLLFSDMLDGSMSVYTILHQYQLIINLFHSFVIVFVLSLLDNIYLFLIIIKDTSIELDHMICTISCHVMFFFDEVIVAVCLFFVQMDIQNYV